MSNKKTQYKNTYEYTCSRLSESNQIDKNEELKPGTSLNSNNPEERTEWQKMIQTITKKLSGHSESSKIQEIVTPEHLDRIIEISDAESKREYSLESRHQIHNFILTLITLVAFIAILFIVRSIEPELVGEIIKTILSIICGFGAGYGVASHRKNRETN